MRVATRIGAGSAAVAVVIAGVLGYELALLRGMAEASRDLSSVTFQGALLTVEQLRTIDELEEHASKFAVTADAAYGRRVEELRRAFVATLSRLERLPLTVAEHAEVDRLASLWEEHPLSHATAAEIIAAFDPDVDAGLVWTEWFSRLRAQGERLLETDRATIATRIEASAEQARRATRLAWSVGMAALGLTLLLGLLLVRSITRPLKRIGDGTRAVAAGELSYYVPPTGDDEFAELTDHFNIMSERLAELERAKRDLLSRVSHDLKTPLAAMIETTRLLRDEVSGPLNPKQRRLLDLTLESGARLAEMISKLLDLSGLEAGSTRYARRDVDLADLVRSVAARFEGTARGRQIAIAVRGADSPVACRCDPDRITSVIENLLENALTFAPPATVVEIGLHVGDDVQGRRPPSWRQSGSFLPDRTVMVRVADRGPGVPDGQKERIFQKFHQVVATPGVSRPGIGLGLAICREIVEAHDGAIWVEDQPGGGSIFYLVLPAGASRPVPDPDRRGRTGIAAMIWLVAAALLAPACASTIREADALFAQGRDVEAVAAYEHMLDAGSSGEADRDRARYRLALLLGSPGPVFDPARARALLDELIRSAPGTAYAVEARLLKVTRDRMDELEAAIEAERAAVARLEAEIEKTRADATRIEQERGQREARLAVQTARVSRLRRAIATRDARVAQLERELERLKQIDLRRRPPE